MLTTAIRPPAPERALTEAQRETLLALRNDTDLDLPTIAKVTGMRRNGAALALGGLERRGLIARDGGPKPAWRVTFSGHALAQRLSDN